jgi:hypothetical protein
MSNIVADNIMRYLLIDPIELEADDISRVSGGRPRRVRIVTLATGEEVEEEY